MIGWKRIVVTVGEKIGKEHLTYGQGASAELVAMSTIAAADMYGMPVSTTHVLSSGVAGTMAANGSGVQMSTHPEPANGLDSDPSLRHYLIRQSIFYTQSRSRDVFKIREFIHLRHQEIAANISIDFLTSCSVSSQYTF